MRSLKFIGVGKEKRGAGELPSRSDELLRVEIEKERLIERFAMPYWLVPAGRMVLAS